MFVDPDFLRMGAAFTESAGVIAQRGAQRLRSISVKAGIFGGFPDAESFHQVVSAAHDRHSQSIERHHAALNLLTEKATLAATTFLRQDEASARDVDEARSEFDA